MKTLLTNAKVWLGKNYFAAHIGFDDETGTIEFVGNSHLLKNCEINFDEIINLPGKLILPAFHDGHCHLTMGANVNAQLNLRNAATVKDFQNGIREYSAQSNEQWICGGYFSESNFTEPVKLSKNFLDEIEIEKPVFISRFDIHSSFVNSKALELSGLLSRLNEFTNEEIILDENGKPTGELKERAMYHINSVIPEKTIEAKAELVKKQIQRLHALGITAVTDITLTPDLDVYEYLLSRNEFNIFDYSVLPFPEVENIEKIKERFADFDSLIKFKCFKAFYDGSLSSKTALMHSNYKNENHSGIRTEFVNSGDFAKFARMIDLADYQMAVHAIGDKSVTELLDFIKLLNTESGLRPRRFRIEHAQHIQPEDFERFRIHHVIASVQPGHLFSDAKSATDLLDDISLEHNYRELLSKGVVLNFGTDFPVIGESPFETIYHAMKRQGLPGDAFTLEECLTAYTKSNAFATYTEESRGSLKPGMIADIIVTDDLFKMSPEDIRSTKVEMTFQNGSRVF